MLPCLPQLAPPSIPIFGCCCYLKGFYTLKFPSLSDHAESTLTYVPTRLRPRTTDFNWFRRNCICVADGWFEWFDFSEYSITIHLSPYSMRDRPHAISRDGCLKLQRETSIGQDHKAYMNTSFSRWMARLLAQLSSSRKLLVQSMVMAVTPELRAYTCEL
jgi:hypothetical protein